MSYREKQIIASLVSSILLFGGYFSVIHRMHEAGRLDGDDALSLLGKAILVLIGVGILIQIGLTVALTAGPAILAGKRKADTVVDERDKLIELRGVKISETITGLGVITAMAALATNQSPILVFNLIIAAFALGGLVSNVAMLSVYRRHV